MDDSTLGSFDVKAKTLVSAVCPSQVAAVVAQFEEPEDICLRKGAEPHGVLGEAAPADLGKRVAFLIERIERERISLERDISKYQRLRSRGLADLSPYDINISSGGQPLVALHTALRLKRAHISYSLTVVHFLRLDLAATYRLLGKPPQLALF